MYTYLIKLFTVTKEIPWVIKVLILFGSIFIPILPAIYTILLLVTIDLITGFIANLKSIKKRQQYKRKNLYREICYIIHQFTSAKLRFGTGNKLAMYMILLLCSHLIDVYLLVEGGIFGYTVAKIVGGFIGLVEFKSIIENLGVITEKPLLDSILGFLNRGLGDDHRKK